MAPARPARGRRALCAAAVPPALLLALCGCGGDGAERPAPPGRSAPGAAPSDARTAREEVTRDWERFFDPATPLKERTALLEDGEQLRLLVRAFGRDPRAKRVRARVRSVRFASSTQAEVRYALSLEGRTVLRDAPGMAVLRDGVWKVSFRTVCELVRLDGGPPEDPAC